MFKKGNKLAFDVANTVIGAEIVIEGKLLSGSGTVRIDGKYIGDVDIHGGLIVGETGVIEGNVRAQSILIAGTVKGPIVSEKELHLSPTSNILGDITYNIIVVDEGAVINGKITKSGLERAV